MKLDAYAKRLKRNPDLNGKPHLWTCSRCEHIVLTSIKETTWFTVCPTCQTVAEVRP